MDRSSRRDKNQNIQVFVRLRPLNQRERDIKSLNVVEVTNNREVVVRQSHQTSLTKKFTFDRAFAPNAKQVEVYQEVVSPLIAEVLCGYNCTVFAYGQTGTGKTHTMVGERTSVDTTWQTDPLAGIIPRALSQLFDELRLSNTEYTIRVSYLELYNEELFDLLSTTEDNSKLRIYENVTRKGSNIVHGLEEITVYNKNEVYEIMTQGQERKRVASTLMNAQSSRSHTVFTIVVHMKENSPEGEELVKIGKLNLVDLAGSENISKAGSDNPAKRERARECVNINQSLLTLGRVITALVEKHPHIPYRESKLTRILQESLGGRTKTSIIATVSPGHKDLEETMSTLEYAHRAKNIQNKPEINQKLTKKEILKEYVEEIDKLKRDLQVARDKNGVYLANETFLEMTFKQEEQKKEIQELLLKKRTMEEEREKMENIFSDLDMKLQEKEKQLDNTVRRLDTTKQKLVVKLNELKSSQLECEEQKHLVSKHLETETELSNQARALLNTAATATAHVRDLHNTVEKRSRVESSNLQVTQSYRSQSDQQRADLKSGVHHFVDQLTHLLKAMQSDSESHCTTTIEGELQKKQQIEEYIQKMIESVTEIKSLSEASHQAMQSQTNDQSKALHEALLRHGQETEQCLRDLLQDLDVCVAAVDNARETGEKDVNSFIEQWCTSNTSRVTSLRAAQCKLVTSWRASETERLAAYNRQRETRHNYVSKRNEQINVLLAEIAEERESMTKMITKQLEDIETERQESENRLLSWAEEERRLLEEKITRYITEQKQLLTERLHKRQTELEEEKRQADERFDRKMRIQEEELRKNKEEMEFECLALEQFENGADRSSKHINKFNTAFDQDTSAMCAELEILSLSIGRLVGRLGEAVGTAVGDSRRRMQEVVPQVVSKDQAALENCRREMALMMETIVKDTKQALDNVAGGVEANVTSTTQNLQSLSNSISETTSNIETFLANTKQSIASASAELNGLELCLEERVNRQEQLEKRYLAEEYRIYSPTGKTPVRQEYRFPRNLANTSPHERILSRYRAMRQNNEDNDCVVIESDNESNRQLSDSESSVSEDSAIFAAPSPPDPSKRVNERMARNHSVIERSNSRDDSNLQMEIPITKCTSENDIYALRKQQSKENLQSTGKKASKLPAPSSLKKPLGERNEAR